MAFFTAGELHKKTSITVDADSLQPHCLKCGLHKNCSTPKMDVSGEGRKKILIIGEVPGREDDEYGIHLVGEPGDLLKGQIS